MNMHAVPVLDPANWFLRFTNFNHFIVAVEVLPGPTNAVLLHTDGSGFDIGPNIVSYSPPPFDVLSDRGLVAAPAFANFPLT